MHTFCIAHAVWSEDLNTQASLICKFVYGQGLLLSAPLHCLLHTYYGYSQAFVSVLGGWDRASWELANIPDEEWLCSSDQTAKHCNIPADVTILLKLAFASCFCHLDLRPCVSLILKKRGVFMWLKTIWMTALQNEVNQVSLYFIMVVRPSNVVFFNAKLSIFISFLSFFIYFMDSPLRCPISFLRGSIYADMHIPISMSHNSFSVCNQNRQIPCRHEDTCSTLMQQW